jgi:hypothetical protein
MTTSRRKDEHLLPSEVRRQFELPFDKDVQAKLNVEQWEQTPSSEIYTFSYPEGLGKAVRRTVVKVCLVWLVVKKLSIAADFSIPASIIALT